LKDSIRDKEKERQLWIKIQKGRKSNKYRERKKGRNREKNRKEIKTVIEYRR
jgi:hypothetical protein